MSCLECNKVRTILQQGVNIAMGVINLTFESKEIEDIARPRLEICQQCPLKIELVKVMNKSVYQCTKCNCLIELKARVKTEVCPVNKW